MSLILSGVQPTNNLHLGNYLGAVKNWVGVQAQHNCLFTVADLHAITVPQDPAALRENIRKIAALYIACGIDPKKSPIFQQSRISGHAELSWILGSITPLGWLERMTQFKDKAHLDDKIARLMSEELVKHINVRKEANELPDNMKLGFEKMLVKILTDNENKKGRVNLGLLSYPVLMAADILLYNATHVPVGEDQKQHLELARDIAAKFNREFGREFFTVPEPMILGAATRVMSLKDATKKMSKSDPAEGSRINLTDTAEQITDKVKRAQTDAVEGISYDEKARPAVANLLDIYGAITGEKPEDVAVRVAGYNFSKFKTELGEVIINHLAPITAEYNRLISDAGYLEKIITDGTARAAAIAEKNMAEVKRIVGF